MSSVIRAVPQPVPSGSLPSAPLTERRDDPVGGIVLMLLAVVSFSCSDATAKYLAGQLPGFEVVWIRYIVFALMLLPAALRRGGAVLRASRPGLQLLRGLSMLASSMLFITCLPLLPLADATAIGFVSPLFITALSIPILGEQVGMRRWAAIAVGLIGVLLVVRPGTGAFQPAAILPILSALAWAAGIILTRKISGTDGTNTTLIYTAVSALVVISLIVPFNWVTPSLGQIGLGLVYGIFASGGQWLVVLSYHRAGASVLAPLTYSQLVWASALGFLIFNTVPDAWTLAGAAIIVASGLYTAHRERVRARHGR